MTIPFHIVYRLSSNSMLNQIILWYSFFFHCLPKWRIIYHFYIHSFRFAQGTKRNENGLPERIFFFIILLIGNSVYYKSRGGEWAVQPAGWPYFFDLFKHDLVAGSFMPPADIRQLRDLMRYRFKLTCFKSSEKNRLQNCLTVSNIQLGNVVSDTFGKSAQAILDKLLENPTDTLSCHTIERSCLMVSF